MLLQQIDSVRIWHKTKTVRPPYPRRDESAGQGTTRGARAGRRRSEAPTLI
jgi:hypothetical protein